MFKKTIKKTINTTSKPANIILKISYYHAYPVKTHSHYPWSNGIRSRMSKPFWVFPADRHPAFLKQHPGFSLLIAAGRTLV
jgi:hypothetical protein